MSLYIFIGHRGVGKSSLAKKIEEIGEARFWDLDREVEIEAGLSIRDIFDSYGEREFRKLEEKTFHCLYKKLSEKEEKNILVLGAGFEFEIPDEHPIFWIQRETDQDGRIFFDRPRLNSNITPLEEFSLRKKGRDKKYSQLVWDHILLQEGTGTRDVHDVCDLYLKNRNRRAQKKPIGGCVTADKSWFRNERFFSYKCQKRLNWGVDFIELRDDLLTQEQLNLALSVLPNDRVLLSYRRLDHFELPTKMKGKGFVEIDWALELGEPQVETTILSLHELQADESLHQALTRLSEAGKRKSGVYLKAAPVINNWQDLKEGHLWYLQDPLNRCFLPRSAQGRWLWYRLLYKDKMKLNFLREEVNNFVLDQPTVLQWLSFYKKNNGLAAILGSPVRHSRTPCEQRDFFSQERWPVLRVDINEEELSYDALEFLRHVGLKAAAVTAPLKKKIMAFCKGDEVAKKMESVNTIWWKRDDQWVGTNTDLPGFRYLCRGIANDLNILVWGGGGTLGVVREHFPSADFASLRSGKLRNGEKLKSSYDVVVWASGSQYRQFPDLKTRPELIIDLSYTEDSLGREFCLKWNPPVTYRSGLDMFIKQAEEQRIYWSRQGFAKG